MLHETKAAAERIRTSPLGRLMYGQRELFHSNLLAWFFEALPSAADAVFQPLTVDGGEPTRDVTREQGNLDLIMRWPGKAPLVIENKVFSVAAREQLDRYEQTTATWQNSPVLVLLSPSHPGFELGRWHHLGYAELAKRIDAALPKSDAYDVQTMRRYAALAQDLDRLMQGVAVEGDDEPVWLSEGVLEELGSSQSRAALHKARAQRVAMRISASLAGCGVVARSAMTRSMPWWRCWSTSQSMTREFGQVGSCRTGSSGGPCCSRNRPSSVETMSRCA